MGFAQAVSDAIFTWQTVPAFVVFTLVQVGMTGRNDWRVAYAVATIAATVVLGLLLWVSGENWTTVLQAMGVFTVLSVAIDLVLWEVSVRSTSGRKPGAKA
jgi:hypothetical protein